MYKYASINGIVMKSTLVVLVLLTLVISHL
jgi:hypothetical protein